MPDIERLKAEIAEQIGMQGFLEKRRPDGEAAHNPALIRAVFAVIVELLIYTGDSIYVDGDNLNAEFVKRQIRAIDPGAFEYVLNGLQSNTNSVR
ncbi:MAG TPA: hypothetical protein DEQ02_06715, partial [Ruminococcaceae bacterium]|nr:hypothetical protein [Oscillospiraceae bacterium]